MTTGTIFDIKRYSINDGPGIRTTIFFKGCPLKCQWCHNPESQTKAPQKTGELKTVGEEKNTEEIMTEIEKDLVFYDQSKGGVTFSGGEPLLQPEFLSELLDKCKKKEIHTAIDTCGICSPSIFNSIIDKPDLFLYDLKIMDDRDHITYTGLSNNTALLNLSELSNHNKKTIIRFPVIPGITDTTENIKAVCSFISSLQNIHEINLLPFHKIAEHKYKRLGMENKLLDLQPPSKEDMKNIEKMFLDYTKNIDIKHI